MTLTSPSQLDSQYLLKRSHSQSDGVLIRGQASSGRAGCSPVLVRKCTNQDNNQKWICVLNLILPPTSSCILSSRSTAQQTEIPILGGGYYYPPSQSVRNAKHV